MDEQGAPPVMHISSSAPLAQNTSDSSSGGGSDSDRSRKSNSSSSSSSSNSRHHAHGHRSHSRDRSVSMNAQMSAPPTKKQRSSDDENETQTTAGVSAHTYASGTGAENDDEDDEEQEEEKQHDAETSDGKDSADLTEESFLSWLVDQKNQGVGAGQLLDVLGLGVSEGVAVDDDELWEAMFAMGIRLIQPAIPARQKLPHVNTLQDVVNLLQTSKKIVVLAGAGISVSCGIPDFRSENGIYSRLAEYNLPNPQCMFDIEFFRSNPKPFFAFAKELFPKSNGFTFVPSRSHYFLKLLEEKGKLLRIYSQNIDMLEQAAGISHEHSVLCHGSFATATCLSCKKMYLNDAIREDIAKQQVPMCKACNAEDGIIKPDIVFFGESLPRRFHDSIRNDENETDLVLVMGSSLKVNPVRGIVGRIHKDTPIILINREPVGRPHKFDVELLGYSDEIVEELCRMLGWEIPKPDPILLSQSNLPPNSALLSTSSTSMKSPLPFEFIPPCRHMFTGAKASSSSSDDEDDGDESSASSNDNAQGLPVSIDDEDAGDERKQLRRWNEDDVDEDNDHLMGSGNELLGSGSFED